MAVEWISIGAAFIGGGVVTDYMSRSSDRRKARADLLHAQRVLTKARRQDLDSLEEAADEVQRLGMIAGVPLWLHRRYRDVTVAEWRAKRRLPAKVRKQVMEEVGEVEIVSHIGLVGPELRPWAVIMDEYRGTAALFEYSVWHPWRARYKSIVWRRDAKKHVEYKMELFQEILGLDD